jgi:uncharacterized protein (DUF697 family)
MMRRTIDSYCARQGSNLSNGKYSMVVELASRALQVGVHGSIIGFGSHPDRRKDPTMASISRWRNLLSIIGEVDVRPIRAEAEQPVDLAIVAAQTETALWLAEQLRQDPGRPDQRSAAPLLAASLDSLPLENKFDLIILIIEPPALQALQQANLFEGWRQAGQRALVVLQESGTVNHDAREVALVPGSMGRGIRLLLGDVRQPAFLDENLVPAVLALLPEKQLAAARTFPRLRARVVRRLINDTSTSNAAYSLTTGLAEIIPVLTIPLNVTDMIILTKAQAFLIYRLGLALGLPLEWQSYLAEFGSVLGGGFLWRQLARMLVGLIPAYGILPKVAIAYSGTYVVGQVVYQWYLTGRHLTAANIRSLYVQALQRGRKLASNLLSNRLRLPWRRKSPALPDGQRRFSLRRKRAQPDGQTCPSCGQLNAPQAHYCQNCGVPLAAKELPPGQPASIDD